MDRIKAYRERHIKLGLCKYCQRPAARPLLYCGVCAGKRKDLYNSQTEEQKIKRRAKRRAQIERMKLEGRCVACCAPMIDEVDNGHVKCSNCRSRI